MFRVLIVVGLLVAFIWYYWQAQTNLPAELHFDGAAISESNSIPGFSIAHFKINRIQEKSKDSSQIAPAVKIIATFPRSPTTNIVDFTEDQRKKIEALGLVSDGSRPSLGKSYRDRRGLIWGEIRRIDGATEFNDFRFSPLSFECEKNSRAHRAS